MFPAQVKASQVVKDTILIALILCNCAHVIAFDPMRCQSKVCKKNSEKIKIEDVLTTNTTLDFHYRLLTRVPTELLEKHADTLEYLYLSVNLIKKIKRGDFPKLKKLHTLTLDYNRLEEIEEGSLDNLTQLVNLNLVNNALRKLPSCTLPTKLKNLDMSNNRVSDISESEMKMYPKVELLHLGGNQLKVLKDHIFIHNPDLKSLDVSKNPLKEMQPNSLVGPKKLRILNLRGSHITQLPNKGISRIHKLDIRDIAELWSVPDPVLFGSLLQVEVTYSVHCCAFRGSHKRETIQAVSTIDCETYRKSLKSSQAGRTTASSTATTTRPTTTTKQLTSTSLTPSDKNTSLKHKKRDTKSAFGKFEKLFFSNGRLLSKLAELYKQNKTATIKPLCDNTSTTFIDNFDRKIICRPLPDAFNPCDDVMGTMVLRGFSWVVSLSAVIGNIFLLLVLFYNEGPPSVYKLLMYHLGIANLIMGVYLVILCSLDAYTFGHYYDFVRVWQYTGGCKVAGFLAILATELSVCILGLVTLERYLLIVHAVHAHLQLHVFHAKIALSAAWIYAIIAAALPLTHNVSSYHKVAICLPFDIDKPVSRGYVIWLLAFYFIMFLYVLACYSKMYYSVNGTAPCGSVNADFKVAKRFSLIVFSNFACWTPISVAGFLTMYTNVSVDVKLAKFLLVFIFPLNACTNPFLYAFFTKIFKGDVLNVLSKFGICQKEAEQYRNKNMSYARARLASRTSQDTNSTAASRSTPPDMIPQNHMSQSNGSLSYHHTENNHQILPSEVTMDTSPAHEAEESRYSPLEQVSTLQSVLEGLRALTLAGRQRTESEASSDKELLRVSNEDDFQSHVSRARSVSDTLRRSIHEDHLEDMFDIDKMSPMTHVTAL